MRGAWTRSPSPRRSCRRRWRARTRKRLCASGSSRAAASKHPRTYSSAGSSSWAARPHGGFVGVVVLVLGVLLVECGELGEDVVVVLALRLIFDRERRRRRLAVAPVVVLAQPLRQQRGQRTRERVHLMQVGRAVGEVRLLLAQHVRGRAAATTTVSSRSMERRGRSPARRAPLRVRAAAALRRRRRRGRLASCTNGSRANACAGTGDLARCCWNGRPRRSSGDQPCWPEVLKRWRRSARDPQRCCRARPSPGRIAREVLLRSAAGNVQRRIPHGCAMTAPANADGSPLGAE